jgi:alpha-1,2-mannosyltransferase
MVSRSHIGFPAVIEGRRILDLNERRFFKFALSMWGAFSLIIVILTILRPNRSLVGAYADASEQFWAGVLPASEYLSGFYYLPASQILYTPIALADDRIGGAVLQLISVALMTWAVWELVRLLVPSRTKFAFAISLFLIISGVAGILRIAQLDALMWALLALAAGAIARDRVWLAAVVLALALAIKPTAIVGLLLMGVLWPRVGVRLVPLVAGVVFAPFLFAGWDYVVRLYLSLADRIAGAVQQPRNWHDIGNMLAHLGLPVPFAIMLAVRAAAAPATLGIAWLARSRLERPFAAFLAFSFAALYLLLFNPRTEGGGYAGLSLVAAPLATRMLLVEGRTYLGGLLAGVCLLMGMPGLTPGTMVIFGVWLKPMMGILVTAVVLIPRALDHRRWDPVAKTPTPYPSAAGVGP